MMNALRLNDGVKAELYEQRTGLSLDDLNDVLTSLRSRKVIGRG